MAGAIGFRSARLTRYSGGLHMVSVSRGIAAAFIAGSALFLPAQPGHARCTMLEASHNGTDMFYDDGAAGTAENKLLAHVDRLKREKGVKRVRVGRIRTRCGDWFMKYMLPHKTCVAKARVCY